MSKKKRGFGGRPEVYDFSTFKVGETRFVSLSQEEFARRSTRVHTAACWWGKRHPGTHFSVQRKKKPLGVLVTRIRL
jgi:hypothetical protein